MWVSVLITIRTTKIEAIKVILILWSPTYVVTNGVDFWFDLKLLQIVHYTIQQRELKIYDIIIMRHFVG